jgi:hypothetical protein
MTDSVTENLSGLSNNKNENPIISLNSNQRVKISKVKDIIKSSISNAIMNDFDKNFLKEFTDNIKNKLKDLKLNRYKIIVQSFLTEQKNQGINLVNKCLFDPKNDFCITEQISFDNRLCFLVVYLIYVY